MYTYMYTSIYFYACVCMHTYIYINEYTHARIHTQCTRIQHIVDDDECNDDAEEEV